MILPYLFLAPSPKGGKGVYTSKNIKAGTTIEISPVLIFMKEEAALIEKTKLHNYVFEWGNNKKKRALGLGYISMYNHHFNANCIYEMDFVENTMCIITIKPIKKGEELFINYNATPNDTKPLWFKAK
ncbi:MAG: SET domain-containing protein-lysine N-methyltransferase [Bacteroidetes bacterium]|nr:SET domain-containing protein-lysine N-methyltransferase [Bacteroidota bacterium]MBS1592185.1 SET domain-containing protein-lysine N-methyltransferase [Bacteroidota bacterium]MBS1639801.1 SET domain-containing protein-lysine N-methyltransferase [Bacteroidota bacterium]MBS1670225.1 SET domain-containing protein-lysine N-methyltransferase [Bacteroidota bacterium]